MSAPYGQDAPPVGEELHLPGPSIQPVLVTFGLTLVLLGIVEMWPVAVIGFVLLAAATWSWIAAARRELRELPPGH
jgi:hypothetical protein